MPMSVELTSCKFAGETEFSVHGPNTFSVVIDFVLHEDGKRFVGWQKVFVDRKSFCQESPDIEDIILAARRKLIRYFDGESDTQTNLFRNDECDT